LTGGTIAYAEGRVKRAWGYVTGSGKSALLNSGWGLLVEMSHEWESERGYFSLETMQQLKEAEQDPGRRADPIAVGTHSLALAQI